MVMRLGVVLAAAALAATIVAGPAHATFPGDDGRIAFSTGPIFPPLGAEPGDLEAHSQVFTITAGGNGLQRLTGASKGEAAAAPDWSPDGDRIAYQSNERGGGFHIWVMNADGSHKRRLTHGRRFEDFQPSWSPDGSQILLSRCGKPLGGSIAYCKIALVNADGSGLTTLYGAGHWFNVRAVFSPDGSQIAFGSDKAGHQSAIWVMDADGSNLERITPPSLRAFWPDWSPDGEHILVTDNCCLPSSNLWTVEPDGSDLTQITDISDDFSLDFAGYSPTGERIVAHYTKGCADEGICSRFYTLDADGSDFERVNTGKRDTFLTDWGAG